MPKSPIFHVLYSSIIYYFASDLNVTNSLDNACHVQTVYNAIDFSYRPSVGKKTVEKSKMADDVPVAMGSSGDQDMF